VGWLPLYVSRISDSPQVGLFLVVEEDAVVLVRQTFHVFFEQKLHNVELGAVQPKKVLDSHGDPVWSHAQHLAASEQVGRALQSFSERQPADVLAQVHQRVEDQVSDFSGV